MNPRPVAVSVLSGMNLEITFQNGEVRIFNVEPYLQDIPALQRLRDRQYFRNAHIAHHTVAWSDDEDICPDTLYLTSQPLQQKAA